jgi:small subunit ribosomal protein S20
MKTSRLARQRNRRVKTTIRGVLKAYDSEKNTENLKAVTKVLDKAASKKVIHKNKATRLKSRLAKMATQQTK